LFGVLFFQIVANFFHLAFVIRLAIRGEGLD
jgi:hypothetical protein